MSSKPFFKRSALNACTLKTVCIKKNISEKLLKKLLGLPSNTSSKHVFRPNLASTVEV